MSLAITVIILSAVLVSLAWPFVRPELLPMESDIGPASHMAMLEERKMSIYGAIREVGFDYRTDKVTEEDYHREIASLKAEAVEVVREMETLRSAPPRGSDQIEQAIEQARKELQGEVTPASATSGDTRFCTQCGERASADDRFCAGCGAEIRAAS